MSTLKAQLTNCKNIFKLKVRDNIRVFSSITNFELAIGLGDVPNDKKTQTIHGIVNVGSTNPSFENARKEIKSLFDYIIKPSEKTSLGNGFAEIKSEQDYDFLFSSMIARKTAKEQIKQVKKETASGEVL